MSSTPIELNYSSLSLLGSQKHGNLNTFSDCELKTLYSNTLSYLKGCDFSQLFGQFPKPATYSPTLVDVETQECKFVEAQHLKTRLKETLSLSVGSIEPELCEGFSKSTCHRNTASHSSKRYSSDSQQVSHVSTITHADLGSLYSSLVPICQPPSVPPGQEDEGEMKVGYGKSLAQREFTIDFISASLDEILKNVSVTQKVDTNGFADNETLSCTADDCGTIRADGATEDCGSKPNDPLEVNKNRGASGIFSVSANDEGQTSPYQNEDTCKIVLKKVAAESRDWVASIIFSLSANLTKHAWNTVKSVQRAHNSLSTVQHIFECIDSENSAASSSTAKSPALSHGDPISIERIVVNLSGAADYFQSEFVQWLTREEWRRHAGLMASYHWFLSILTFPRLSDFLGILIPPALHLLDDYALDNKVKGVESVRQILLHCGRTELRWYGRADVVYDALFHLTYTKEPALSQILYPTLLAALDVVSVYPDRDKLFEDSKHDVVFRKLLCDMHLEDKLDLREAFSESVVLFVRRLKTGTAKHLKRLFPVIYSYLEVGEARRKSRFHMLEALNATIELCWPCMKRHTHDITKALLRLFVDLEDSDDEGSRNPLAGEEVKLGKSALVLLSQCDLSCHRIVTGVLQQLDGSSSLLADCLLSIEKVGPPSEVK